MYMPKVRDGDSVFCLYPDTDLDPSSSKYILSRKDT